MMVLIQYWEISIWVFGLPILAGLIGSKYIRKLLLKLALKSDNDIDNSLILHCFKPLLWLMVFFVIRFAVGTSYPEKELISINEVEHLLALLLIGLVSWFLIKAVSVFEDIITSRFDISTEDNLQARKIHTQFRVLKRIVIIVVIVIAVAAMLMTFPRIKQLGTAIFASAGIIGIILGFAAQRTLSTFIAGLQIAFTQPIRVDDVVIVEGEWGRIEEITLTYVVVKIWDLRRLIVPITYFIEKPFQNWTRVSADILGTVFLYADYNVPVEELRKELERLLKETALWDGKVCGLVVTNATEKAVELRALMSASDASAAWNLRCYIREQLIDFIKTKYPKSLPKFRAEMEAPTKETKRSTSKGKSTQTAK
ncbi:MAG: mechanosensitive ion channel [Sedimentisphaerales bacterium]|nr:mechanosensitive ion channel [Sedimentisphaerales bacterium]